MSRNDCSLALLTGSWCDEEGELLMAVSLCAAARRTAGVGGHGQLQRTGDYFWLDPTEGALRTKLWTRC